MILSGFRKQKNISKFFLFLGIIFVLIGCNNDSRLPPNPAYQNIKTKELVKTIVDDSVRWGLIAHNNFQYFFDSKYNRDEDIQELFKREDAGKELLMKYKEINAKLINELKFDKGDDLDYNLFHKLDGMGILFAQESIFAKLTKDERLKLLNEVLLKYRQKNLDKHYSSCYLVDALLFGRVLRHEKYKPFLREIKKEKKSGLRLDSTIENFLRNGNMVGGPTRKIFKYTKQFLSN